MKVLDLFLILYQVLAISGYYIDETDEQSDVSFFLENIRSELSEEFDKKYNVKDLSASDVLTRLK